MKKTTWVIIGLSICVLVLATALGIVLMQKKTEIIVVREPDFYPPDNILSKPWQSIYSFSLSPRPSSLKDFYKTGLIKTITIPYTKQKAEFFYYKGKTKVYLNNQVYRTGIVVK